MSTQKQIIANRANAAKSTGPSPQGLRISCTNSTKHGLFARHLLVNEQDRPKLAKFSEQIYAEYPPKGPTEMYYVNDLIAQWWRLRTCLRIETDLFEYYKMYENSKGDLGVAFAQDASQTNSLTRLSRYAPRFERELLKDLAVLRKLQARPLRPESGAPSGGHATHTPQAQTSEPPVLSTPVNQPPAEPSPTPKNYFAPCGALAEQVLLSDEDATPLKDFVNELFAEWQPRCATKALFVELLAVAFVRQQRLSEVEADLFEQYRFHANGDGGLAGAFVQGVAATDCFCKLEACETRLRHFQSKILKELLS